MSFSLTHDRSFLSSVSDTQTFLFSLQGSLVLAYTPDFIKLTTIDIVYHSFCANNYMWQGKRWKLDARTERKIHVPKEKT